METAVTGLGRASDLLRSCNRSPNAQVCPCPVLPPAFPKEEQRWERRNLGSLGLVVRALFWGGTFCSTIVGFGMISCRDWGCRKNAEEKKGRERERRKGEEKKRKETRFGARHLKNDNTWLVPALHRSVQRKKKWSEKAAVLGSH